MGSTSWAELYFRSLKLNKVLSLLTKYLLQYRRLCIPHVGTFELVQQPAEFSVVDQLMLPPAFRLSWTSSDFLPEHQLSYLAAASRADKEKTRAELDQFGQGFYSKLEKQTFTWNGIGTVKKENGSVHVAKEFLQVDGWEVVPAHKVVREHAEHSMLVGDRQMTSQQVADTLGKGGKKRSYVVLIGWILFVLTLLAIIFLLYKNGFNPLSSGLKMKTSANSLYL